MFRILEAQAPAKQNATDTITTLSGRLQSATLLEDRRAAILGLRSFAKQYPASVASGSLRNLINCLNNDVEDVDTTKLVLETLWNLFSPDESSPEASDDITLWLADEFTQKQENITVLLDLLGRNEFSSRLYSLRLLFAISTARPERTRECVYTAPLGVSRLVASLDDEREELRTGRRQALRNEALSLLIALTPSSPDLQKLIAFENAFDKIFAIIKSEWSLPDGGAAVEDCLSLLANLLRLNASNQSYFQHTGGATNIAQILARTLKDEASEEGIDELDKPQRDKNLWGLLSVIRLFLAGGSIGTRMNQDVFWKNGQSGQPGIVAQILEIAFHPTLSPSIRSEALLTCADLIRGNESIQEAFSRQEVKFHVNIPQTPATPAGVKTPVQTKANGSTAVPVNVIQGLLDLALAVSCPQPFNVRLAATECIKACLHSHGAFRLHFLQHAKDGHDSEQTQADNVFSILLDGDLRPSRDIWESWIASVILLNLIHENYEAKQIAMGITQGDASKGEEPVTCIQSLSANLISKATKAEDMRTVIGYLMLLSSWLYEDMDAVNDFLQEGSSVQALIQIVLSPGQQDPLEAGLCAFLLGIIYEFSSKDSPIPRSKLHEILKSRLGRDYFTDKMTRLREHPYVRDFEVLGQDIYGLDDLGQPLVFFDKTFIDFLKDNFSRVYRAFDRDPNIEVSVIANGVQKGISRELVDTLNAKLDEKTQSLQKVESEKLTLEQKLGQEQADHRRTKDSASVDFNRLRAINESLQKGHNEEITKLQRQHSTALREASAANEALQTQHKQQIADVESSYKSQIKDIATATEKTVTSVQIQMRRMKEDAEATATKIRTRHDEELADLRNELTKTQKALEKAGKDHAQDLSTAHEEYQAEKTTLENRVKRAEDKSKEAENRAKDVLERLKAAESKASQAEQEVTAKEEARQKVQSELEDLLMVLSDLEEKRAADKKRLKALGEEISDSEGEDNDEDEEE